MLLAIDTSTRSMSIALHDGQTLHAEQTWIANNQHNTHLAPAIQAMLAACGTAPSALTALAVAQGPGSYTGLRIGIALAKGIAAPRNLPLVGVATPDIVAEAHPAATRARLIAVVDAGRGRIIAAIYRWRKSAWKRSDEPQLTRWDALLASLEPASYIVTGEVDAAAHALLAAPPAGVEFQIAAATLRARRAGILAEIAQRQLALSADPAEEFAAPRLLPMYVQTPE